MINSNGLSIKFRILFTATVTILVWTHLIWDHFHGGVPTHYFLQSEDMPGISNWWGGITLPLTTFLLLLWAHKNQLKAPEQENNKLSRKLIMRFFRAFWFGVLLSVLFSIGSPGPGYMMLEAIILSFFVPHNRQENMMGFILGIRNTFGANLHILVSLVLLIFFLFAYKVVRFGIVYLNSKLNKSR